MNSDSVVFDVIEISTKKVVLLISLLLLPILFIVFWSTLIFNEEIFIAIIIISIFVFLIYFFGASRYKPVGKCILKAHIIELEYSEELIIIDLHEVHLIKIRLDIGKYDIPQAYPIGITDNPKNKSVSKLLIKTKLRKYKLLIRLRKLSLNKLDEILSEYQKKGIDVKKVVFK